MLLVGAFPVVATHACTSERQEETATSNSRLDEEPDGETCDGLPHLRDVRTPRGVCVGIVAKDIAMARGIVQLADGRFLVTAWASNADGAGEGALWMLRNDGPRWVSERVTTGWKRPHGVVVTENQEVYIAEPNAVSRFYPEDPGRKDAPLIGGLPDDGAHWATTMAYDSGFLYVDVDSASDNCAVRDDSGVHFTYPCADRHDADPQEGRREAARERRRPLLVAPLFPLDHKDKSELYELWLAGHGREEAEPHTPGHAREPRRDLRPARPRDRARAIMSSRRATPSCSSRRSRMRT